MRSTWKRALSTLLTIALLASLLIVPASAATETYTLDDLGTVFKLGGTASSKSGYVQLEKNEASWIEFEVTGTDVSLEVTATSTGGTNKSNFILKQVGEGDALTAVTDVAKKDADNSNITITNGDVEVTGQSSDLTVVYDNLGTGTYRVIGSCTGRATRITGLSLTETDGKTYCAHENTTTAADTAASCTAAGKKGDKTCTDCSTVLEEGSVIPKLGHSFKDGVCEVCNANAPTAAVTLDFTTGNQADSPYLIEVAGHNGSSSSGYIKLDSNGKLVFKAPGAGKVVFTFTDDNNSQGKAVAINGEEKTLPETAPTLEVETTANQEITMVRSSNTQPRVTGLTWTPADEGGEDEHTYTLTVDAETALLKVGVADFELIDFTATTDGTDNAPTVAVADDAKVGARVASDNNNHAIVVWAKAATTAPVDVTVTNGDQTATIAVTVVAADAESGYTVPTEWTLTGVPKLYSADKYTDGATHNAASKYQGLTFNGNGSCAFTKGGNGLQFYGTASLGVPVDGPSKITVKGSNGSLAMEGGEATTLTSTGAEFNYTGAAGTVTLTGSGVCVASISVEPAAPTVDKTALTAALTAAKAIDTTAVEVSAAGDGSDVLVDKTWVTQAVKDALTTAIADAEKLGDDATQEQVNAATTALTTATTAWNPAAGTKLKTMTGVTAANVTATYNGQPKQITVTGAPTGATVTYCDTQNGTYAATPITVTNVADSPKTVYYKVEATGYEPYTGSATITVNKAADPGVTITVANNKIPAAGRTVTFTVKGIPTASTTAPTAVCDQAAAGATISFTKQADGSYKGTNEVTASSDGAARDHLVTMTWNDPNYVTVTKTVTLKQAAADEVVAENAEGLDVWNGVDYAALGADAVVSAEDNAVTLTIDEAKILAAYAADADTFKSASMNHGGNAYMMIHFEAPANVTTAWTVKQTVNDGTEGAAWKLDGTGGDLDCWAEGDKLIIGDWFGVLMGVEGDSQTMPAEDTYIMGYNFYDEDGKLQAATTYTVVRQVVEAVNVSVAANADLTPVTAFKASPSEELTLTVAVKDGVDKVLPETITVTLNGEAMAAADYTWNKTSGTVTIAAAQLTAGDAIVITVTPAEKPVEEYTVTVTGGTADKAKAAQGADVTVTANAAPAGKVFDKWTATGLTLTEADAAKATLTFKMPAANVALTATYKDEGGEGPVVPTEGVFTLDVDQEVTAGKLVVDQEVAGTNPPTQVSGLGSQGLFTIIGKASGGSKVEAKNAKTSFDGDYTPAYHFKLGGGVAATALETEGKAVKFTTGAESTVKIWWASGSGSGSTIAMANKAGDGDATQFYVDSEKSAQHQAVVTTVENVPAGTNYVYSPDGTARIYKIEVNLDAQGGETVDKTALTDALAAAKAIDTTAVKTSANGEDVPTTEKWVTQAVKDALAKAIDDAEKLAETATQEQVNAATKALTDATAAWNPADGLKTEGEEPKPANKTALQTAITNAEKKVPADIYVVGDDTKVSEVDNGTKFMTESDKDTYDKALAAAKALLAKDDATQAEVDAAVTALNAAAAKVKTGKKGAPAPSGGSTSRGEDAAGTTTETKADGSTVTTTTDRQGNKTVVTQRPDGSKITAVIKADGTVTIATVNADGETVADVKVPGTMPTNPQRFVDVPDEHWAAKSINDMAVLGVVRGVDDVNHIFDMKSDITRGSVATILFRFSNGKTGLENVFSDVAEGKWYTDGIAWASKVGVVNGFEDGTFKPENSITRAQLATMIARYAKIIGLDTTTTGDLSGFVDGNSVQSWAVDGMAWCVANGIVNGRGNNTLAPNASASRAEAAAMFDRFVQLLK